MDLYQVLQVAEDATRAEIRAAYLVLVQESHPDRRNANPALAELASEARFKRIQEAFETLYDPARRAAYDRTRVRPLVHRGHVVAAPSASTLRRDIPAHWLRRTGPSGRARPRLGRWILLALLLAVVLACLSLGRHWLQRLSSRAEETAPAARPARPAAQVAISSTGAQAEARQSAVEKDADAVPPGIEPDQASGARDGANGAVEESAEDPLPVDTSVSRSIRHPDPTPADAGAQPLFMYAPSVGDWAAFDRANHDPRVIVQASWQVEDPLPVLSGYRPLIPSAPLPDAIMAPLPVDARGFDSWDALIADAADEALLAGQVDDSVFAAPLPWPLADEMPILMARDPPSLGEMASPDFYAAMQSDPADLGSPVPVPFSSELAPTRYSSGPEPPPLTPLRQPHRAKHRATKKWEPFPWSADQNLEPRPHAPLTLRTHVSLRGSLEAVNQSLSGTVRWPMFHGIDQVDSPRGVSPTAATWPTSPAPVDLPTTGIRSGWQSGKVAD